MLIHAPTPITTASSNTCLNKYLSDGSDCLAHRDRQSLCVALNNGVIGKFALELMPMDLSHTSSVQFANANHL